MASRRKRFNQPANEARSDIHAHAAFMKALLDGTITATALVESRDADGKPILQYDDPNG